MRIALAADHRGVALKAQVVTRLRAREHRCEDFGPSTTDPVDYPDYAAMVAESVARGESDRGVLICGSGIGMAIAANKVRGIRAAAVDTPEAARLSREHNDANVLALSADRLGHEQAMSVIEAFLEASFAGGRHQRRVDKIRALESFHDPALHGVD